MIPTVVFPAAFGAVLLPAVAVAVHEALLQSPRIDVIAPGYPAWWFGLTWRRKASVLVTLPVSGAMAGLGWWAAPLPATAAIVTLLAVTVASRIVRAAARQGR
jgi:hypothetical protein